MSWRLAPSLEQLRDEVDRYAPKRNKASDGTIGDASHQATQSDHNPNGAGIVCAIDFTHDPDDFDAHQFANLLRIRCKRGRERRVAYIISNDRITSPRSEWEWREYTGSNPHDKHIHISIRQAPNAWRNTELWKVAAMMNRRDRREDQAQDAKREAVMAEHPAGKATPTPKPRPAKKKAQA